MNRKDRRLKRRFLRRKKRVIRQEVNECKNAIGEIMNCEYHPFVKLALSVARVAAWQRNVDMIAAQSYYPDGGMLLGFPVRMVSTPYGDRVAYGCGVVFGEPLLKPKGCE